MGFAGYGAAVGLGVDGDGQRIAEVSWPDGNSVRRQFDASGFPGEPRPISRLTMPPTSVPAGSMSKTTADLDGDGRAEAIRRHPESR